MEHHHAGIAESACSSSDKITRDTTFQEDLNADSLDQVELIMEFEDKFDTSIPDSEAEKIKTVGQAIDVIKDVNGIS